MKGGREGGDQISYTVIEPKLLEKNCPNPICLNPILISCFLPDDVRPGGRYGQSQIKLDEEHLLVLGGCRKGSRVNNALSCLCF